MVPERHTIFQVWHIRPLCHLSENRVAAAVFGKKSRYYSYIVYNYWSISYSRLLCFIYFCWLRLLFLAFWGSPKNAPKTPKTPQKRSSS